MIVEDIAKEGAFEKAVKSDPPFEAVIHTASPFHFNVTDTKKDLLDPAIIGTTGVLKAIKKHAPSVKKVVCNLVGSIRLILLMHALGHHLIIRFNHRRRERQQTEPCLLRKRLEPNHREGGRTEPGSRLQGFQDPRRKGRLGFR